MNVVEMKHITKQYPLVRALDQVDFTLKEGEIHSLLGENGAGKSTLMKILYGMCIPDTGTLTVREKTVAIKNPRQAIELGIGMVHQHFMLTPVMTVTENIVMGNEPVSGIFFNRKEAVRSVSEMIAEYGFGISADAKVAELSVGEQQRVEILKALYCGANILIMDEPTAVLTPQEVSELFTVMRRLKAQGKSIIIITHKLKETLEIADRMSVLRDGRMVGMGLPVANATADQLARLMVGRDVVLGVSRRSECIGSPILSLAGLKLKEQGRQILDDIAITLHKGEILGIAGIEGNGQTELIEVLTGLRRPNQMALSKDGKEISGNAGQFIRNHIGHVPEDRMTRGLVQELPIEQNLILGYHKSRIFARHGILKKGAIRKFSDRLLKEFKIKAPDSETACRTLSGGNQQKVVIARVFSEDPDVIIIAQPTRGVDIGSMEYIHNKMLDLRDEGKAILLISADLDEVRSLSDRLLVMYDGKIVAGGNPDEFTDTQLGLLMTGAAGARREQEWNVQNNH